MSTQETKLKDIADAIRAKEGSSDPIIANDFPARIAAIQTGTDTSDATATAGDILSGETAYVASGKVTGTIPTKTESNISVSGPTIIVPSGYYGSQVSKSVATVTQATPTISVNSSGLITASSTQSAGYVTAGTKNATRQLTTQAGKTITPGRTQQTAVSNGRYTTGTIYVAGDTDLTAANIKKDVSIFGVTGTYEGEGTKYKYYAEEKSAGDNIRDISRQIEFDITFTYEPKILLAYAFHIRGTSSSVGWVRGGMINTWIDDIEKFPIEAETDWYGEYAHSVWDGFYGEPQNSPSSLTGSGNPKAKNGKTVTFEHVVPDGLEYNTITSIKIWAIYMY